MIRIVPFHICRGFPLAPAHVAGAPLSRARHGRGTAPSVTGIG